MKVMLLAEGLRVSGGVERFVCALANRLADEGMAVAIGTPDSSAEEVPYPLSPSVRILHGPVPAGWAKRRVPTPSHRVGTHQDPRTWRAVSACATVRAGFRQGGYGCALFHP